MPLAEASPRPVVEEVGEVGPPRSSLIVGRVDETPPVPAQSYDVLLGAGGGRIRLQEPRPVGADGAKAQGITKVQGITGCDLVRAVSAPANPAARVVQARHVPHGSAPPR